MAKKLIYPFGDGTADGDASMKYLLGGKGANLAEMNKLGLPVPPGFTITTDVFKEFYENKQYPVELEAQINEAIAKIEKERGEEFGSETNPLLVSVRSGAANSMPGMMETVLNLGLTDISVKALAKKTNNDRFAYDSYRRFIQMFSNVVMGMDKNDFEAILDAKKDAKGIKDDKDLTAEDMKELSEKYKDLYLKEQGHSFPQDVKEQLWKSIGAVFNSWDEPKAVKYRNIEGIPHDLGTAVNIQAMVFGNKGNDCATGVAFTRDRGNGEKVFNGEWLINAQGEDVVDGSRTPNQITNEGKKKTNSKLSTLEETMPEIYQQLLDISKTLEANYKDMQDIEFTIEADPKTGKPKLWMLQTRDAKRNIQSALKVAIDMVNEGLTTKEEALLKINPKDLNQLMHPITDPEADYEALAKGLPASPGVASGEITFSSEEAEKLADAGKKVLLCRKETSPEDIGGMKKSQGVLTAKGGITSHAALVTCGWGKPCVVGAGDGNDDVSIDYEKQTLTINGKVFKAGDMLSINGETGEIIPGKVPTIKPKITEDFKTIMKWADEFRTLKVRTNAETVEDIEKAIEFGAEGIGLIRTEHMFFNPEQPEKIRAIREMILANNKEERKVALDKLFTIQKNDFKDILKKLKGLPATFRLLDPPLHEFLPQGIEQQKELADIKKVDLSVIQKKIEELHESNPMLGHRGCRLAITYPEIPEMQSKAIFTAAVEVMKETGIKIIPEVMVPLVSESEEFAILKKVIDKAAREVKEETNFDFEHEDGTMIETPRATLIADEIVKAGAKFFSFGTNDLTQMTFGFSRDDAGTFLPNYLEKGILSDYPFTSLDQKGVGKLITMAINDGRSAKAKLNRGVATEPLKVGICGEHGGDPKSIGFCHRVGMNYVSCSPYKIPIAKLAAAQAAIKHKKRRRNESMLEL